MQFKQERRKFQKKCSFSSNVVVSDSDFSDNFRRKEKFCEYSIKLKLKHYCTETRLHLRNISVLLTVHCTDRNIHFIISQLITLQTLKSNLIGLLINYTTFISAKTLSSEQGSLNHICQDSLKPHQIQQKTHEQIIKAMHLSLLKPFLRKSSLFFYPTF